MKRKDIYLLLALAALIGAGFLVKFIFFGTEGTAATIRQPGGRITEVSLNKNTTFQVDDTIGGINTIVVKDGKISVTESNCPDQTCIGFGEISQEGEFIACLPHGLIITIGQTAEEFFGLEN